MKKFLFGIAVTLLSSSVFASNDDFDPPAKYTRLQGTYVDINDCEGIWDIHQETPYNQHSAGRSVWRISDPKVEENTMAFTSLIANSCDVAGSGS